MGEEDSTVAVAEDFVAVVEEGLTVEEGSTPEAALGTAGDATTADIVVATTADIVVATTEAGATTEVAAVMAGAAGATAGAEDIGAEDTVTDGDLALGGRIGDGDIRIPTTTTRGITLPTLIILTRPTALRTIPRSILILTTGTTILHRQIPTHVPSPTRTAPQAPGDPWYREAQPALTTQTPTWRELSRVGRFPPLTG